MKRSALLIALLLGCGQPKETPLPAVPVDSAAQTNRLYPVDTSREDSAIFTYPGFTVAYIPKANWVDTLNVIEVHADSSEASPIVALIGNRRTRTGWERVYLSNMEGAEGEMIRVSADEWGVFAEDVFDSWLEIHYASRGKDAYTGWAKYDSTRIAIYRSPDQDTVRAHLDIAKRFFGMLPDSLRISKGACPFECCTYREWDALRNVQLFTRERDAGRSIATIPKGERFEAITGNVHIIEPAVVAIENPTVLNDSSFARGDTLVLIDYLGEGWWHVWNPRTGKVVETNDGWAGPPWKESRNHRIGNYRMEWWAQVRRSNGQRGWINVSRSKLGNTDACGM